MHIDNIKQICFNYPLRDLVLSDFISGLTSSHSGLETMLKSNLGAIVNLALSNHSNCSVRPDSLSKNLCCPLWNAFLRLPSLTTVNSTS